ncbi:MAG: sulfite exporter TauE/SafE family protein [candidate division Zixibacteria bacterium]|nr:sulfite exporter TauE/SafE family protein [candidate division Zixibacteria bacterium]
MELWTAFIIGLAGSLHCIGMCGPIAIALPLQDKSKYRLLIGRVLYNFGRIITYAVLGLIFGFIGQGFFIGGYQQTLSIVLGVLMLLTIFLPSKYASYLTGARLHEKLTGKIRGLWRKLMEKNSISSLFLIGLLNGFLPCGLVYIAIAGSIATGTALGGALYMAVFGFGTFPVMLAMSLIGRVLNYKMKLKLKKLLPVGVVVLATLFILRGLSMGIPYISPKIEKQEGGQTTVDCCHKEDPTESIPIE